MVSRFDLVNHLSGFGVFFPSCLPINRISPRRWSSSHLRFCCPAVFNFSSQPFQCIMDPAILAFNGFSQRHFTAWLAVISPSFFQSASWLFPTAAITLFLNCFQCYVLWAIFPQSFQSFHVQVISFLTFKSFQQLFHIRFLYVRPASSSTSSCPS